jgi:prophage maintenance system killer protein
MIVFDIFQIAAVYAAALWLQHRFFDGRAAGRKTGLHFSRPPLFYAAAGIAA